MLASVFAILAAIAFFAVYMYDNRNRTQWEAVGDEVWMQRRVTKSNAHFIFRTSDEINPSSLVPALWEIKKPFSRTPTYISQHPEQLRVWWEPLTIQFAALGRNPKHIVALGFAPSLGIYTKVKDTRKTQRPPGEDLMVLLMQEARNSWKPRRLDIDSSYHIRESLLKNWIWPYAVGIGIVVHGFIQYRYIDFMGDLYYAGMGSGMALLAGLALAFWFYPKMDGSIYRVKTSGMIVLVSAFCLAMTLPFALIWANMRFAQVMCEVPAPVTQWYTQSGKTKSYYATLTLKECESTRIPATASIQVPRSSYQHGNNMNIRISRGILGRYYLEMK